MLNMCVFQGRLTSDPELRYTANNVPVCTFSIAVEQSRKNSNNETVTNFIPVVAWRSTAEFIAKFFNKGKMIIVSGEMVQRKYEKNGEKRSILECVADTVNFSDTRRDDNNQKNEFNQYMPAAQSAPAAVNDAPSGAPDQRFEEIQEDDRELPF